MGAFAARCLGGAVADAAPAWPPPTKDPDAPAAARPGSSRTVSGRGLSANPARRHAAERATTAEPPRRCAAASRSALTLSNSKFAATSSRLRASTLADRPAVLALCCPICTFRSAMLVSRSAFALRTLDATASSAAPLGRTRVVSELTLSRDRLSSRLVLRARAAFADARDAKPVMLTCAHVQLLDPPRRRGRPSWTRRPRRARPCWQR